MSRAKRHLATCLLAFLAGSLPAIAQEMPDADQTGTQKLEQAVISADEISYDESLNTVFATGNVEVAYGERIMLADSVRYNRDDDSVIASGNVTLLEPNGEVVFAEYVELNDELRSGVIENIRLLLADDSRFAANGARRIDGRKTIMRKAVYSPCAVCEEDPERPPLWQLKASTIIHDQQAQDVNYTNAWLELFGVPVFYTPYLTHPDPTVERRSGVLTPRMGSSLVFGGFLRVPLFIVFNDSIDMTIEPIVTVKEPPILALEYRQRFNNGLIEISGSGTKADRETGDLISPIIEQDVTRGHLFAEGIFSLNDNWRTGFDYRRASDPTYLDRYGFFGEFGETLESVAFIEGFHGRTYSAGNIFGYQDLRLTDPEEEPIILPSFDHNYLSEADGIGGRWSLDANFRSTMRDIGPNTRRLSLKGGYAIPFISDYGLATTFSASLQADGYHMDRILVGAQEESNVLAGRAIPRAMIEMRYPFVRGNRGIRQVIEPVAAFIAAPNNGNPFEIPQEDSVVVELDDTNLFSEDQIPGLDRVDTGQRAVYGLKAGLYGEHGGRVTSFFGQSYRLDNDANIGDTSDLHNGKSDYVGRLLISPDKYMDLLYRFRLAEQNFELLRGETSVAIGPPSLRVTGDHIYITAEASNGLYPDREELNAKLSSQLTDYWSIDMNTRRDLTRDGGPLEYGAGITYEDECFRLAATFRRDFTKSVDVEEETVFSIEIVLKSLGNVSVEQAQP
ncbi:MAG: LPS assembly protein LptD [Alphaproteobacteria bacterium]|nr:LPS assembly protein LptD [Alphaproteobacteria bacterium]